MKAYCETPVVQGKGGQLLHEVRGSPSCPGYDCLGRLCRDIKTQEEVEESRREQKVVGGNRRK